MHFSRVIGGYDSDIEIVFKKPLSLRWEEESFSLIDIPRPVPKCSEERFIKDAYPSIIYPKSEWADKYAANIYSEEEFSEHKVTHYVFISMNDLLHVLSEETPLVKILSADNA